MKCCKSHLSQFTCLLKGFFMVQHLNGCSFLCTHLVLIYCFFFCASSPVSFRFILFIFKSLIWVDSTLRSTQKENAKNLIWCVKKVSIQLRMKWCSWWSRWRMRFLVSRKLLRKLFKVGSSLCFSSFVLFFVFALSRGNLTNWTFHMFFFSMRLSSFSKAVNSGSA